MNNKIIELANVEIHEYCLLNLDTFKIEFSNKSIQKGFTGLYYKDDYTCFALYPSIKGPTIFYKEKEYLLNKELTVTLKKEGKKRQFTIAEFNIEIDYMESPYIGFDAWSDEIDVDLFYLITQKYTYNSFYDQYTLKI